MSETTFENIDMLDRVYDLHQGWGKVESVIRGTNQPLEFTVSFPDYVTINRYNAFGMSLSSGGGRRLFWREPEIIAPPRPKRSVEKTLRRYVNIFKQGEEYHTRIFSTVEYAKMAADSREVGIAIPVVIQWEEEE